jgi:hypothetical protein
MLRFLGKKCLSLTFLIYIVIAIIGFFSFSGSSYRFNGSADTIDTHYLSAEVLRYFDCVAVNTTAGMTDYLTSGVRNAVFLSLIFAGLHFFVLYFSKSFFDILIKNKTSTIKDSILLKLRI